MPRRRQSGGRRVQLHRALSKLGWGSRTQAWEWIRSGEVCVDGRVVTDPLTWVDLDQQQIRRRGEAKRLLAPVVLALHKPRGIVTTRKDERGRRTVYELLPTDLPWVFPAGRLDAESEGLLIFANDAALAVRLTDPEQHLPKTYHVTLDRSPERAALQQIRRGIELPDGRTRPVKARLLAEQPSAIVAMVLTEGRNRQIRRMWWRVGYRVRRLVRVAIGGLELGDLPAGKSRLLTEQEVGRLLEGRSKRESRVEARSTRRVH
jgi:23S rRNA pseudouridine2605 synthase